MDYHCSYCRQISSETAAIGPCPHRFCRECRRRLASCPRCLLSDTPSNIRLSDTTSALHPMFRATPGISAFTEGYRRHDNRPLQANSGSQHTNDDVHDALGMFTRLSCSACKQMSYELSSLNVCAHGLCPNCKTDFKKKILQGVLPGCPFCQMDSLAEQIRDTLFPTTIDEHNYKGYTMGSLPHNGDLSNGDRYRSHQ